MNFYFTQREPIGTPKVYTTLTHDLYLSVMNIDPQTQTLGLHAMINPMIGWIWIATFIMGLGGVIGLVPTRRRREEVAPASDAAATPLAADAVR
jgi:cytochrome c biogenesis factor